MSDDSLMPQERRVMIVPVGLERERIVKGCTAYAVNVVYLINNPKLTKEDKDIPAVYKYSLDFSTSIAEEFRKTYRIIITKETKLNSFYECITLLNEIYKDEEQTGKLKEIFVNISTASKAFALGAYIFALFHSDITTIFYLETDKYILLNHLQDEEGSIQELKNDFKQFGLTRGPYYVDEIPLLPVLDFSSIEKDFIKILAKKEKFDSIDNFRKCLPKNLKEINRVKIRRVLLNLEKKNLIHVRKLGRYQEIYVSKLLKKLTGIIF